MIVQVDKKCLCFMNSSQCYKFNFPLNREILQIHVVVVLTNSTEYYRVTKKNELDYPYHY